MRGISFIVALCVTAGCGSAEYDWTATRAVIDKEVPVGTSLTRAHTVLDSLGATRGAVDSASLTMVARLREPNFGSKSIFSTLRVIVTVDSTGQVVRKDYKVVLTGT